MLGIPERRIFRMVVSGELEGRQDEHARWRIPASAVRRARQALEPSVSPVTEAPAASDDDAITVATGSSPPWKFDDEPDTPVQSSSEETTWEAREAPLAGDEITQNLPEQPGGPSAPDHSPEESVQEPEDLQTRLELAEQARYRLEKEVERLEEENHLLRAKLEAARDKGVLGKLFGE